MTERFHLLVTYPLEGDLFRDFEFDAVAETRGLRYAGGGVTYGCTEHTRDLAYTCEGTESDVRGHADALRQVPEATVRVLAVRRGEWLA